jgi:glycosyltransferase involved in cell wall biosynthesis
MRILILDENYPHLDNLFGDVFVHVRAKEYALRHEVKVFSYFHSPRTLTYESISIEFFNDKQSLIEAIKDFNPDRILVHFYQSWMLEEIIKVFKVPVVIWVHGYEALGWYRRLFNYTLYSPVLLNYIIRNTKQQYHFRRLIKYANRSGKVRFVFVSDWMRRITETDTLSKIKRYDVIANPIDGNLFKYVEKDEEARKKILILRSFGSKKYANDIAVKAILILSERKVFSDLTFTIIGDGSLFDKLLNPLRKFSNITIKKGVVRQIEIPAVHKEYGIFLCPTRQDAQGVSMCEAMSGGVVPITSYSTAIPEFVTNNSTGILTRSPKEIADAIELLYKNEDMFKSLSRGASDGIRKLCDIEGIIKKELIIIENPL